MQLELARTRVLTGHSISNIKSHNLRALLLILLREEAISRVRLAQLTGLSTTTITNQVAELLEQGLVTEEGREAQARNGAGRPATALRLVPEARVAVGLHIGVDTLRVGVTDLAGKLQTHRVIPLSAEVPAEQSLLGVADLITQVLAEAHVAPERLVGLGVGASGLVDPVTGVNLVAPNLGWRHVPIPEILSRRLRMPIFVDNNVRAMALAEAMFGAGRGVNTLAFVYSRIGVGAGFVVGGDVYRGSRAGAGEIGHVTMIPAGGAPCRCGNTGCLETLVSEPEIVRQAQVLARRAPDSILAAQLAADGRALAADAEQDDMSDSMIERVFAAARAGDRETLAMLDECASYMGTALANLVNLINPDMIILGGLFATGADLMLQRIEETMRRRAFAGLGDAVALRITSYGRKVGVIGAAALALDAFFYQQQPANEFAG